MCLLDEGVDHRLGILALQANQHHVASVSFHQGRDLTVIAAAQEVALPVTGHRTILSFSRSFPHRDRVSDSAVIAGFLRVMA